MALNLTQKIIAAHLESGTPRPGAEIGLRIDQTLTQDASGTMAYLQFEAMGLPRVCTELSVSYVDHGMLQTGFENADDHRFLQSIAARYGIYFSRPGNGICHQVHLERFARPGRTLLGSDSHTPNAGAMAMVAIGAGGLDVAVAMGGGPYYLTMPRVVGVCLTGSLGPWVTAKDVILELLRRRTVKGGVGTIFEFYGEGVATLSVPQRATVTNMGAELGATTSLFPSDEGTRAYLAWQGREEQWAPLAADDGADYDDHEWIDLSALEPLIAQPQSPDNVVPVREVAGLPVAQVCVGSCNNSSYADLMTVAALLEGQTVHPDVSMTITPGSQQTFELVAQSGALAHMITAGARILEAGCGPCIGMGQAPPTGAVSVRTFHRNFNGRSGTLNDRVYLASPEVAVATAVAGRITDPRTLGAPPVAPPPAPITRHDRLIIAPPADGLRVEVLRGPNIKPLPVARRVDDTLRGEVLLKVGDNITTDHIMPAGAQILPLRSNVPACAEHVFGRVDPTFPARARAAGGGFVVGGANYGQGSAREHAALAPMYLGVRAVLARSFARIHRANLINFGIVPLVFAADEEYEAVAQGDQLEMDGVREAIGAGTGTLTIRNLTRHTTLDVTYNFTPRQAAIVLAGGLLNLRRYG
ncbi:MAG: aconitate hydratase [Chloroflexota bacterium]